MLADQLGLERAVILHVDDLAMCHGGNRAYLELAASGAVTCGSVMVPCPWFREIAAAVAQLDEAGLPIIDHFRGTLPVEADQTTTRYRETIEGLSPGVTLFALHATMPGEIETIAPAHAGWRTREFALFASGAIGEWLAANGITAIGYRDIQRLWRAEPNGACSQYLQGICRPGRRYGGASCQNRFSSFAAALQQM